MRFALVDCRTHLTLGRFAHYPLAVAAYHRAVARRGWHTFGCYLSVEVV